MTTLITHGLALLLGCGGGWYLHYRFGSKLAALESKIKGVV